MKRKKNIKIFIIIITILTVIIVGNNMSFASYGDDDATNDYQQDGKISGKSKDDNNQDITGQGYDEEEKAQQGKDPTEATKTTSTKTKSSSSSTKSSSSKSSSGTSSTDLSWDSIWKTANNWLDKADSKIDAGDVANKVLPIGQMLTAIGVAILFGGIIILGIKYMISEPEQKGKLKQQLIGLVVAGVVIFGAYTIWKLCYDFFTNLLK